MGEKGNKSTNRIVKSRNAAQDTIPQLKKQERKVNTQNSSNLLNTSPVPPHCLLRIKKPTICLLIHKLQGDFLCQTPIFRIHPKRIININRTSFRTRKLERQLPRFQRHHASFLSPIDQLIASPERSNIQSKDIHEISRFADIRIEMTCEIVHDSSFRAPNELHRFVLGPSADYYIIYAPERRHPFVESRTG